jgi:hypothetical protein
MLQSNAAIFDWVVVWENQEGIQNHLEKYAKLGKRVVVFKATQRPEVTHIEEPLVEAPEKAINSLWSKFQEGIRPYFGMDRLKQTLNVENDLALPMALQKKEVTEQEIAFLLDGFLSQTDAADYAWEWQQQEELRQKKWELIPVWSTACWQNLPDECRKIAAHIISLEKLKKQSA